MMKSTTKNVIKFYELINWLFAPGVPGDVPENFIIGRTKLNSMVPYLIEQFWNNPELTAYLNKHSNDLYNIPDPIEYLKLLKKLIQLRGVSKYSLYSKMPIRNSIDIVKELQERELLDEGNAMSKALMLSKLHQTSQVQRRQTATKAAIKQTSTAADKALITTAIEIKESNELKAIKGHQDKPMLAELNQDIIDQEGLVLFDISVLKKTNRVLMVFIDKNNTKRYYTEPFYAEIYKSNLDGVRNNDYIVDIDENIHQQYIIRNVALYNKLKFMLNKSYGRIINGG